MTFVVKYLAFLLTLLGVVPFAYGERALNPCQDYACHEKGGVLRQDYEQSACYCKCFWGWVGKDCSLQLEKTDFLYLTRGIRVDRRNGRTKYIAPRKGLLKFGTHIRVPKATLDQVCQSNLGMISVQVELESFKKSDVAEFGEINILAGLSGKTETPELDVSSRFPGTACYLDPFKHGSLLALPKCESYPVEGEISLLRPTHPGRFCRSQEAKEKPCWWENNDTSRWLVCCESLPLKEEYVVVTEIGHNEAKTNLMTSFSLKVKNQSSTRAVVDLYALLSINGDLTEIFLDTITVKAHGVLVQGVSVGALKVDVNALKTAGALNFKAYRRASGILDERVGKSPPATVSITDTLYFIPPELQTDLPSMVVMTEKILVEQYDGGDFRGRFGRLFPNFFPSGGLNIQWAPPKAPYVDPHTLDYHSESPVNFSSNTDKIICVTLMPNTADYGNGEDFYANAERMAARGMKYSLEQGGVVQSGYLDPDTGCAQVTMNDSEDALFRAKNKQALGANENILIGYYYSTEEADGEEEKESVVLIKATSKDFIQFSIPTQTWNVMMALAGFSFYRIDQLSEHLVQEEAPFRVIFNPGANNSYCGGYSLYISPNQLHRKFLHGHEVWHCIGNKFDANIHGSYNDVATTMAQDPYCFSDNVPGKHLIWSLEGNRAARNEGMAQLAATAVWNNLDEADGIFVYYKNLDTYTPGYDELLDSFGAIDIVGKSDLGGIVNWRDNRCDQSYVEPLTSVEGDWARALAQMIFNVNGTGALMTFREYVDLLVHVRANYYYGIPVDQASSFATYSHPKSLEDLGFANLVTTWEDITVQFGIHQNV